MLYLNDVVTVAVAFLAEVGRLAELAIDSHAFKPVCAFAGCVAIYGAFCLSLGITDTFADDETDDETNAARFDTWDNVGAIFTHDDK